MPLTKTFTEEILFFRTMLENKTPFAISRFGDGERIIMEGTPLNLLHKGEFNYQGQDDLREDLTRAFQYDNKNYFIGISCPCCQPLDKVTWMKESTYLPDSRLTWANIFVNGNFRYFREYFIKEFTNYTVTFIGPGNINNLPFDIKYKYSVGPDAWIHNTSVYSSLKKQIIDNKSKNELFLFCAGPYANILIYKLYKEFPENTYLDLGSVFNIELGIGANRGYLSGGTNLQQVCVW